VRYPKDLAYRDELSEFAAQGMLNYFPIISREDPSWQGERGHLQKLFERGVVKLHPGVDHLFVRGLQVESPPAPWPSELRDLYLDDDLPVRLSDHDPVDAVVTL
jgi:hypothetical protein